MTAHQKEHFRWMVVGVRFSQFARDKTYGQYWTQIRGAIYFHSILYSKFDTSTYIEEVWERFGQADSHGCVRLTVPDAKWMYYHIAPGTECVIRDGEPEDAETAAIREQLILAEAPDQRLRLEPSEIPDTDNWSIEDIPIEVEFVQGSQILGRKRKVDCPLSVFLCDVLKLAHEKNRAIKKARKAVCFAGFLDKSIGKILQQMELILWL